jgi:hypothetical protein
MMLGSDDVPSFYQLSDEMRPFSGKSRLTLPGFNGMLKP